MPKNNSRIEVVCPCCQATLLVDSKTGLILKSQEKKTDYSFERGLQEVQERNEKSEELFAEAFYQEQQRQQGLEAKFRQALDSEDELDEPPRLWDLD
jgi:predicted amidophosphoribosyltransferase